jgi:hypothetical protein
MQRAVGIIGAVLLLISVSSCAVCETNSDCDDGIWCNGAETCALRPFLANLLLFFLAPNHQFGQGQCMDGAPPCCPADHDCLEFPFRQVAIDLCDESQRSCETGDECRTDAECDDGVWCNGAEFCTEGFCFDLLGRCEYLETCDEAARRCLETNKKACFRILDLCPDPNRTSELAQIALVLGTADIPDDVTIFGDNVCEVTEAADCDWPRYADCLTDFVVCEVLDAGDVQGFLDDCLDILPDRECFVPQEFDDVP